MLLSLFVGEQSNGTSIGVGIGVGILLCFVLLTTLLSILILVIVVVKRKAAYKQKRDISMRDNSCYRNSVMKAEGIGMKDIDHGNEHGAVDKYEELGSIIDGFSLYANVDGTSENKKAMIQVPKESCIPASATNVGELYAIVDKSKKKGAREREDVSSGANEDDQNDMPLMKMDGTEMAQATKESSTPASDISGHAVYAAVDKSKKKPKNEREDMSTVENKNDLCAMPKENEHKTADEVEGVLADGSVEEAQCDATAGLKYKPTADIDPGQQCERDMNIDTLYAVVDKSQKKRQ